MVKMGIGYDIHPLKKGSHLVVGGMKISGELSSDGHSDGDALIHAIIDAILGAANLGDIGQFFPSDEKEWKGMNSTHFLSTTIKKVRSVGYKLEHVDTVVILQKPEIRQFIPEMQLKLAQALQTNKENISVKATTTDHLGFIGTSEGWGALAIASLSKLE